MMMMMMMMMMLMMMMMMITNFTPPYTPSFRPCACTWEITCGAMDRKKSDPKKNVWCWSKGRIPLAKALVPSPTCQNHLPRACAWQVGFCPDNAFGSHVWPQNFVSKSGFEVGLKLWSQIWFQNEFKIWFQNLDSNLISINARGGMGQANSPLFKRLGYHYRADLGGEGGAKSIAKPIHKSVFIWIWGGGAKSASGRNRSF